MAVDLTTMSTGDLVALVHAAAAELARRTKVAPIVEVMQQPENIPADVVAPSAEERTFIKSCLDIGASGGYILASDKTQYAEIASRFPGWFRAKRYPTTIRGRAIEDWSRHRAVRPA